MSNDNFFAVPRKVKGVSDCYFYHTMEVPGYGVMQGEWDLRSGIDEYLGKVAFGAQRVLEIGPASGFLTFEMEKRGAEVVSVEVTEDPGWDFVPYPTSKLEEIFGPRRIVMEQLKKFLLVQSRCSSLKSESILWRCLPSARRARRVRHRSDGVIVAALQGSASDR